MPPSFKLVSINGYIEEVMDMDRICCNRCCSSTNTAETCKCTRSLCTVCLVHSVDSIPTHSSGDNNMKNRVTCDLSQLLYTKVLSGTRSLLQSKALPHGGAFVQGIQVERGLCIMMMMFILSDALGRTKTKKISAHAELSIIFPSKQ
jgi:hypothetical protein